MSNFKVVEIVFLNLFFFLFLVDPFSFTMFFGHFSNFNFLSL